MHIRQHSTSEQHGQGIDLRAARPTPACRGCRICCGPRDGSFIIVDPGSANGTAVNGSEIPPGQPVPLHEGDRIHLGAWTELTIIREG